MNFYRAQTVLQIVKTRSWYYNFSVKSYIILKFKRNNYQKTVIKQKEQYYKNNLILLCKAKNI